MEESKKCAEVSFETLVTQRDLMNFKLYHNYHSFSGITSLIFGIICLVICKASFGIYSSAYTLMMAFFAFFFTVYTPIGMYTKVRKQMKNVKAFSEPLKYTVTEDKIVLSQNDVTEELMWEDIFKVKAMGSGLILYVTSVRANVIPFRCLGDEAEGFLDIAQKKLTPFQIKVSRRKVIERCHNAVQH